MNKAQIELLAMQDIAEALSNLPDGDARNRVLRWAGEHFGAERMPAVMATAAQTAVAAPTSTPDPENLDSLFVDPAAPTLVAHPVARSQKPATVASVMHSFVADFRQLARDWQNA